MRKIVAIVIVLVALVFLARYPGFRGFHTGQCEEPRVTTVWLGVQFCRAPTELEQTEAQASQLQECEADGAAGRPLPLGCPIGAK
jgi:hypothetical protein